MIRLFLLSFMIVCSLNIRAQNPENWTKEQLMEPSELAQLIQSDKDLPVVFSVGPGSLIPHSINIGMAKEKENLEKLEKELSTLPKETKIIVYCGCCPFEHCPNVRPAIDVLNKMKFRNYYLLNLPNNIKADWLDKGYPSVKL